MVDRGPRKPLRPLFAPQLELLLKVVSMAEGVEVYRLHVTYLAIRTAPF